MSYRRIFHTMSGETQVKAYWKWLDAYDPDIYAWECSNCGEAYMLGDGTPFDHKYFFCPHCGVMMIGYEVLEWEDEEDDA